MSTNKFNEIFEAGKQVMVPLGTTFEKFTKLVECMERAAKDTSEFASTAFGVTSFCKYYLPLLGKEEIWADPEFGKGPPIIGERGETSYSSFVGHLRALVYEERFRRWLRSPLLSPELSKKAADFIPYLFHNERPFPEVTASELRSLDPIFIVIQEWGCVQATHRWFKLNHQVYHQAFFPLLKQQNLEEDLFKKAHATLPPFLFGKETTPPDFTFDELQALLPLLKSVNSWTTSEAAKRARQLLNVYGNTCHVAILRRQAATKWTPRLLPPARPGAQTVIHPHLVVMQAKL